MKAKVFCFARSADNKMYVLLCCCCSRIHMFAHVSVGVISFVALFVPLLDSTPAKRMIWSSKHFKLDQNI